MKYHSVLKRKELPSHEESWRNLKCVFLSESSHREEAMYCVVPMIRHSGKGKTGDDKKISGSQGLQGGGMKRRRTEDS